jgi:dTDP-4-dehydrorhamnose 3,5-epimerase
MDIKTTPLNGLLIIQPDTFIDERGFFLETYQFSRYAEIGIVDKFVQDNQSRSSKGVLRGLHFQSSKPQSQLVTLIRGRIFDVCVDLRSDSNTFGEWFGIELSDDGPRQLYMSPGFAHGFCVLSSWADLHYKVTEEYDSQDEFGVHWNDPDIAIKWPIKDPIVGIRDNKYTNLRDLPISKLPHIKSLKMDHGEV